LAVISALGERGHPEREGPLLLAWLQQQPSERHQAAALTALQELAPTALAPALLALLPGLSPALQRQTLEVLGALGNPNSIAPLRNLLHTRSAEDQAVIALALASLDAHQSIPDLLSLLPGAPPALQRALIQALGQLQAEAARPLLLDMLQSDAELQAEAALALAQIPGSESMAGLVNALGQTQNPGLQATLVEAIGQRGGSESIEQLHHHWEHWSLPVKRTALRVIGRSGEAWVLPLLADMLQQEDWRVCLTTLEVLGHIPGQASQELLRSSLQRYQDEHSVKGWLLRSAAHESLDRLRLQLSEI
jgi:HEAT repeat protein